MRHGIHFQVSSRKEKDRGKLSENISLSASERQLFRFVFVILILIVSACLYIHQTQAKYHVIQSDALMENLARYSFVANDATDTRIVLDSDLIAQQGTVPTGQI